MTKINLEDYSQKFLDEEIDGVALGLLDKGDLQEMNIKIGDRKKFRVELDKMKEKNGPAKDDDEAQERAVIDVKDFEV